MTRTSGRPVAAVGLALAILAYVGCSSKTAAPPTAPGPVTEGPAPPPPPPLAAGEKLFTNWPTPVGAIVISGQQNGYLDPCGCTEGQKGGLGRRLDFLERLRAQKWPLALVDLGSLIEDPATARGGPKQTEVKFTVALRALALMGYDALALSADDLKLGVFEALGHVLNLGEKPRVVAANVAAVEGTGMDAVLRPALRTTAGSVPIGVTAVLDPKALAALNDPAKGDLLVVTDPAQALPGVLADLEKDTRIQVLLVQGPPQTARTLALAHPGFEVVVATSPFADPPAEPELLNGGKTMLVSVGKKGQYLGVVGLFADPQRPLRYQRVTLNTRYKKAEPMRKLIDEDFPAELKALGVLENYPRHAYIHGAGGSTYVGAESCKGCHPNTYTKWASTKHAHAYDALTKDPRRNREADAECVSCHTTGFTYTSGFVTAELTPLLKHNQCENCHGPGSAHAAAPDDTEIRKAMIVTVEQADKSGLCLRCHDEDNDPHFNFAKYYGQIVHKGMDTYTDPEVHRGIPPKVARKAP
ncbi:MAG TPA: multiheme c-type cytochrome [Isosphaeraceae bacterium]